MLRYAAATGRSARAQRQVNVVANTAGGSSPRAGRAQPNDRGWDFGGFMGSSLAWRVVGGAAVVLRLHFMYGRTWYPG